jgi:Fe-S-cluster-containing dehydrogenase component
MGVNLDERYGLLFDYEFCTGCHTCEIACKKEHGFDHGVFGISCLSDGPRQNPDGRWEWNYVPVPSSLCDLCVDRVNTGRLPTCVHHCQAGIISYGTLDELVKEVNKPIMVLYVR